MTRYVYTEKEKEEGPHSLRIEFDAASLADAQEMVAKFGCDIKKGKLEPLPGST